MIKVTFRVTTDNNKVTGYEKQIRVLGILVYTRKSVQPPQAADSYMLSFI